MPATLGSLSELVVSGYNNKRMLIVRAFKNIFRTAQPLPVPPRSNPAQPTPPHLFPLPPPLLFLRGGHLYSAKGSGERYQLPSRQTLAGAFGADKLSCHCKIKSTTSHLFVSQLELISTSIHIILNCTGVLHCI